jgi:phosphohistidine swiveling domain-containing protein
MPLPGSHWEQQLYALADELETLFDNQALDIEFAVVARPGNEQRHTGAPEKEFQLYLLQVRPLTTLTECDRDIAGRKGEEFIHYHEKVYNKVVHHLKSGHIDLPGSSTIFGVMSDWNPAEIIGLRPRPLATSLYKELVTDRVAMASREELGYRRTTGFPLMIELLGRPYIDLRVSFASFIPASLDTALAHKLVNYYLNRVRTNPELHDKVEFDVMFTCTFPGLRQKMASLENEDTYPTPFTPSEMERFRYALLSLTNRLMDPRADVIGFQLEKISKMEIRRKQVMKSDLHVLHKLFLLIEDLKYYGTQAFASLARFGFMAKQLLVGLVSVGALNADEEETFMCSIHTVSKDLAADQARMMSGELSKEKFLQMYGHLRPGTYDIMSSRYDEEYDLYFSPPVPSNRPSTAETKSKGNTRQHKRKHSTKSTEVELGANTIAAVKNALVQCGLNLEVDDLFKFMRGGIEGREYSKFIFTKAVSDILVIMHDLGAAYGINRSDMSFVPIDLVHGLYTKLDSTDLGSLLRNAVENGKSEYNASAHIELPILITSPEDVYASTLQKDLPNFITKKSIQGKVVTDPKAAVARGDSLEGSIVCVMNADPGWDWLFTKNIGSLITCFGGANSHMAIRSAELNLPAIIGCGAEKFSLWSAANVIRVDCKGRLVQVVQ